MAQVPPIAVEAAFLVSGLLCLGFGYRELVAGVRDLVCPHFDLRDPASLARLCAQLARSGLPGVWAVVTGYVAAPSPVADAEGAPAACILTSSLETSRLLLRGGLGPSATRTLLQGTQVKEAPVWGLSSAAALAPPAQALLLPQPPAPPAAAPQAAAPQSAALALLPPPPQQQQQQQQPSFQQQPLCAIVERGAVERQLQSRAAARVTQALAAGPSATSPAPSDAWSTLAHLVCTLSLPHTRTVRQDVLPLGALLSVAGTVTLSLADGASAPVLRIGRHAELGLALFPLGGQPAPWPALLLGAATTTLGLMLVREALRLASNGLRGGGGGGGGGGGNPVTSIFHTLVDSDTLATDGAPTCCLCFENRAVVLLEPCGHLVLCSGCARRMLVTNGRSDCPMCRARITRSVRAYT